MDLSVILNVHNETEYLEDTLSSLAKSITFAAKKGVKIELVIVCDNSPDILVQKVNTLKTKKLFNLKVLRVNNRSLSLSRNDGIEIADGKYIATADGDDLVSEDYFFQSYCHLEKQNNKNVVAFPQFVMEFGNRYFIYKYVDSTLLSVCDFAYCNPYGSRIILRKEFFLNRKFKHMSRSGEFAYEDWDFNCYLRSINCIFSVVPNAVLFYRQRNDSIMDETGSTKFIPDNELFNPEFYVKQAALSNPNKKLINREIQRTLKQPLTQKLKNDILDQGSIEPQILKLQTVQPKSILQSIPRKHWAYALVDLFHLTGSAIYQQIYLISGTKEELKKLSSNSLPSPSLIVKTLNKGSSAPFYDLMLKDSNCFFLDYHEKLKEVSKETQKKLLIRFLLSIRSNNGKFTDFTQKTFFPIASPTKNSPSLSSAVWSRLGNYFTPSNWHNISRDDVVDQLKKAKITPFTDDARIREIASYLKKYKKVYSIARRLYYSNFVNNFRLLIKKNN